MTVVVDPLLSLAISMQSNPGIYALLLGSGVSRSAGIPTGWEVTMDLTRKVAELQGEDPNPDPERWYVDKYGMRPDYSRLLLEVAGFPAERQALLRGFCLRGGAPGARARRTGAPARSARLLLEECQMGKGPSAHHLRRPGLLGILGLP